MSHQLLSQVDLALMRAIREHAGFAHVLLFVIYVVQLVVDHARDHRR